jgi:hypothetical protein
MTRADRIAALLATAFNHRMPIPMSDAWYVELTGHILVLADDRQLLTVGDFARIIDRNKTTLLSWVARGQHDVPPPAGRTDNGAIWDTEQIEAWKDEHQDLCGPLASDTLKT